MPAEPAAGSETRERPTRRAPFGAPHVFVLAVVDGEDPGAVYRVTGPETLIGRGEDVDVEIGDEMVSKQHCLLRTDGPVCAVRDLGSLNGTLINGRPVREGIAARLRHLDELEIGDTRLLFLAGRFATRL